MTGKLNNSHLHTQADSKARNLVFTSIADSTNHTSNTTVAKSAGNSDSVAVCQKICSIVICEKLRINPFYFYFYAVFRAGMVKCFYNTQISIVEGDIFSYQCDCNTAPGCRLFFRKLAPF